MEKVPIKFVVEIQVGQNGVVNTQISSIDGQAIMYNEIIGAMETSKSMFIRQNIALEEQAPPPPKKEIPMMDGPTKPAVLEVSRPNKEPEPVRDPGDMIESENKS